MHDQPEYDVLIIGSGAAGLSLALKLAAGPPLYDVKLSREAGSAIDSPIAMLHLTRTWNSVSAASFMRRGMALALVVHAWLGRASREFFRGSEINRRIHQVHRR